MNCRENFEANRSIIHVDIDIVRGHTFSIESRLYMYTGMGFRMNKRQVNRIRVQASEEIIYRKTEFPLFVRAIISNDNVPTN